MTDNNKHAAVLEDYVHQDGPPVYTFAERKDACLAGSAALRNLTRENAELRARLDDGLHARALWAQVYGAEFAALRARMAACYVPRMEERGNGMYGCAIDGNDCARVAKDRADTALRELAAISGGGKL